MNQLIKKKEVMNLKEGKKVNKRVRRVGRVERVERVGRVGRGAGKEEMMKLYHLKKIK